MTTRHDLLTADDDWFAGDPPPDTTADLSQIVPTGNAHPTVRAEIDALDPDYGKGKKGLNLDPHYQAIVAYLFRLVREHNAVTRLLSDKVNLNLSLQPEPREPDPTPFDDDEATPEELNQDTLVHEDIRIAITPVQPVRWRRERPTIQGQIDALNRRAARLAEQQRGVLLRIDRLHALQRNDPPAEHVLPSDLDLVIMLRRELDELDALAVMNPNEDVALTLRITTLQHRLGIITGDTPATDAEIDAARRGTGPFRRPVPAFTRFTPPTIRGESPQQGVERMRAALNLPPLDTSVVQRIMDETPRLIEEFVRSQTGPIIEGVLRGPFQRPDAPPGPTDDGDEPGYEQIQPDDQDRFRYSTAARSINPLDGTVLEQRTLPNPFRRPDIPPGWRPDSNPQTPFSADGLEIDPDYQPEDQVRSDLERGLFPAIPRSEFHPDEDDATDGPYHEALRNSGLPLNPFRR